MNTITERQSKELQAVYDLLNRLLFGGRLPKNIRLTLNRLTRNRDGGLFVPQKWSDKNGRLCHEIVIDQYLLNLEKKHWIAVLVHQMVHLWQFEHGKKIPPHARHTHNREFADKMKELGLPVTASGSGRSKGSETGDKVEHTIEPEGEFERMMKIAEDQLDISDKPRDSATYLEPSANMPKSPKYRHYCPQCSNREFETDAKELDIKCGKCDNKYATEAVMR
ncbi:hypothetical protein LEP3755_10670 [Leptolyngbya sp. NIES-3755]|nr:hypothetical protein LEP3755_10670 [Leptolyngbya sp. NIES-3755]